jgi:hypothetical protein
MAEALGNIAATYDRQAEDARRSPDKHPCQPGQDNRESDLCAQWKAADAADRAAWWSRYSGALSLIGLIGVAGALLLTVQSNRIAARTSRLQLRPYVLPIKPRISRVTERRGEDEVERWAIKFRIRNGGVTPARNVRCDLDAYYFELPVPREPLPRTFADPVEFAYIGPQETRWLMTRLDIPDDAEERLRHMEAAIVAVVAISYDFFDDETDRVPAHQYMAMGMDLDIGKMRVAPEWAYQAPEPDEEGQGRLDLPPPKLEPGDSAS